MGLIFFLSKICAVFVGEKVQCVLHGVSNATGQIKQSMENSLSILRLFPLSLGTMFLFSISTVHVTCTALEINFSHYLKRKLKMETFFQSTENFYFRQIAQFFCTEQTPEYTE